MSSPRSAVKTGGNRRARLGDMFVGLQVPGEVVMRMVIEARLEGGADGSAPVQLAEFERADGI